MKIIVAILGIIGACVAGAFTALASKYKFGPFPEEVPEAPKPPSPPIPPPIVPISAPQGLSWATQKDSYHSVRVLCDRANLSLRDKNTICAVIMGESQFYNDVVNKNKNAKGIVTSTDWSICQVNDHFHIGKNKDFPSVEYVLTHTTEVVSWMIKMYKQGHIDLWCAYSNGSYKRFLQPDSPMWKLGIPDK